MALIHSLDCLLPRVLRESVQRLVDCALDQKQIFGLLRQVHLVNIQSKTTSFSFLNMTSSHIIVAQYRYTVQFLLSLRAIV